MFLEARSPKSVSLAEKSKPRPGHAPFGGSCLFWFQKAALLVVVSSFQSLPPWSHSLPHFCICVCVYVFFLSCPQSRWDTSSPTRDWTCAPCSGFLITGPPGKSPCFCMCCQISVCLSLIRIHKIASRAHFLSSSHLKILNLHLQGPCFHIR